MESARRDAAESILSRFGASLAKAEQLASAKTADPWLKKVTAARMALEYAVLATAREKGAATEVVASALTAASVEQQAAMIKEGAVALGRAFRVEPEVLANVFAGKMTDVSMPKGLGSTPEIDKMVDTCRSLVTGIVQQEYASRGQFTVGSYDKDSFIALKSDGVVSPAKSELASRVAFMESAIDSASKAGSISVANAGMLKDRIEAQVFQPRPPQSLGFSKEFAAFFEHRGKGIRIEAMTEVRGITQSRTVQDIEAKLKLVMPLRRPVDHRTQSGLER